MIDFFSCFQIIVSDDEEVTERRSGYQEAGAGEAKAGGTERHTRGFCQV